MTIEYGMQSLTPEEGVQARLPGMQTYPQVILSNNDVVMTLAVLNVAAFHV